MKNNVWKQRMIVMVILLGLILVGCGGKESEQEKQVETVVPSEETEEEEKEQVEETVVSESVITPEPTDAPKEIELPEIDEKYAYHLYSAEEVGVSGAKPIIGINVPEGWVYDGVGMSESIDNGPEFLIAMTLQGTDIDISHIPFLEVGLDDTPAFDPTVEIKVEGIRSIIINQEERAVLETPFGEAKVYWMVVGYEREDEFFDDFPEEKMYEENGVKYLVSSMEVAIIKIGTHKAIFKGSNDSYEGVLEETVPQMLQAQ